jgi:nitrogen fixation NifU-like protein
MKQLYQEIILDHYKNPRNQGLESPFFAEGMSVNPICGDEAVVRLSGDERVWMTHIVNGCAISQAAASLLSEILDGVLSERVEELLEQFTNAVSGGEFDPYVHEDLEAFSGVVKYPARIKCALLPADAVHRALTGNDKLVRSP